MKIKIISIIILISTIFSNAFTYEVLENMYEFKDIQKEKQKFVNRLIEDNIKIDLAIKNTKKLIESSKNLPYLPDLYLRLAELFVEKSRIAYFIRKSKDEQSSNTLTNFESKTLKNQAIEIYQRIIDHFPEYSNRDRVYFFMAHEFRELGQINDMISSYNAIIEKFPLSDFVPESYLLIGDHFFKLQNLNKAQTNYEKILNYPKSPAFPISQYKLGWCFINRADFNKAIKYFENALTGSKNIETKKIDTYKRVDIRLESLVDIAYCYPDCYKDSSPKQACQYFKKLSWSRQAYIAACEKLARRYKIKKKWDHAAYIYRELCEIINDENKLIDNAKDIFECVHESNNFSNALNDVSIIVKALKKQKYSAFVDDEKKETLINDFEIYAREIITRLHKKARTEKSVNDFIIAANAYEHYLNFFVNSNAYHDMAYNYAEALFSAQKYLTAGIQYEKLSNQISKNTKAKQELLYSSIISYYNALKNKDNLTRFEKELARSSLRQTGKKYVTLFKNSDKTADVLFNIAWINYDEGKYDKAIDEFSDFILQYPDGREAKAAIHLILDSYYMKEDFHGLVNFGQKIIISDKFGDKIKSEVTKIVSAAESKIVNKLSISAIDDWEKGRQTVISFAKKNTETNLGAQALYSLLLPAKEKKDLKTIFSVGNDIINNFPEFQNLKNCLNLLISTSNKISQYSLLCNYMEKFVNLFPEHENSKDFIYEIACISDSSGELKKANKYYNMYLNYESINNKQDIIFQIFENEILQNNFDNAVNFLLKKINSLDKKGKARAHLLASDTYFKLNSFRKSDLHNKKAKKLNAYKTIELNDLISKLEFNNLNQLKEKYLKLTLKNELDNTIVLNKSNYLKKLEKGYNDIIKLNSPLWVLNSLFSINEININFSNFLINSPLPELNENQKEQYLNIIKEKALPYSQKGQKYLELCLNYANKWELCQPQICKKIFNNSLFKKNNKEFASNFIKVNNSYNFIDDKTLYDLHLKLYDLPLDEKLLYDLAKNYFHKNDFNQAALIANKLINNNADKKILSKSYNILGLDCLNKKQDNMAKDYFKKALKINPDQIDSKINLAALLFYYGYEKNAHKLFDSVIIDEQLSDNEHLIHPHARIIYNEYINTTKN